MKYRLFKKIKFLLTSSNQHGVHSPFVFNYLTKCLYAKKVYHKSKTIDILLKSISYFEYNNLQIIGSENVKELVRREFGNCEFDRHPIDLVFIKKINPDLLSGLLSEEQIHNDSMVLINDIHKNKNTTAIWSQIIKEKKATVTIDFHHCGVVFFRQEQVKEHFKIRL